MNNAAKKQADVRTLSICAMLAVMGLMFSYIEFMLPINWGIPGVKLGLANIATLLALYYVGTKPALYVSVLRIALSALLFGSLFSALYSLAGGLLSFLVIIALKKCGWFSVTGVSMAGGAAHNLAQVAIAALITNTSKMFLYYPALLLAGMAAGIFNGIVTALVLRKIK